MAIKFGLAVNAQIQNNSIFARKNYFYPDLPKGYQISQFEIPIVSKGSLKIRVGDDFKEIRITRAHLEEDAGKSIHDMFNNDSAIDLNRAGTPLIEIVSEPDMTSADEAVEYLRTIHTLVKYLDICDGNMQEGSFRCDANISLKKSTDTKLGIRAEIKNINSFKFVEQAINYEIERQSEILDSGGEVVQRQDSMIRLKIKPDLCVLKKKQMIIGIFLILICFRFILMSRTLNQLNQPCPNSLRKKELGL